MKIDESIIELLQTKEGDNDTGPLILAFLTLNLAQLYVLNALQLRANDAPVIIRGNSRKFEKEIIKRAKGVPLENVNALELIEILDGTDTMRQVVLFNHVAGFLKWVLEQEVEGHWNEDESPVCWYDFEIILEKWNEYKEYNLR